MPEGKLTNDTPVLQDEGYTYDAVGNRQTVSGVTGSITHNQNNELDVYGDISYDYDANGNLTEVRANDEVVWTYTYDAANRLVHAEDSSGSISADYYYDPFGRRLWKDVGGTRTDFFYSDEGLIAEYDANGQELRSYGYQPDATWTTDPLWLKQQGAYYWYQNDHLGTPQKLVAVNGTVVWSAQYAAFGQAVVGVETVVNNLRFPGQYFDPETGLHYNFHRYYDPGIGRYSRVDPLRLDLYRYANMNPISHLDYNGLQALRFNSITIHQYYRKWSNFFNVAFGLTNEDLIWGHWWIEIGPDESYGWWPVNPKVRLGPSILQIKAQGELNYVTAYGRFDRDPDHGHDGDNTISAIVSVNDMGILEYGKTPYKGQKCSCLAENNDIPAVENAVKDCVRDFAHQYGARHGHVWTWPTGPNCRSFIWELVHSCCMSSIHDKLRPEPAIYLSPETDPLRNWH